MGNCRIAVLCGVSWAVGLGSGFWCVEGRAAENDRPAAVAEAEAMALAKAALLAGVNGDLEAREAGLLRALKIDPDCQLARWSLGEISVDGGWQEALNSSVSPPKKLDEYARHRNLMFNGKQSSLQLAAWCRANDLHNVGNFHLAEVIRSPNSSPHARAKATRILGLKQYGRELLTQEEIDNREAMLRDREKAAEKWEPRVRRWKKALASKSPKKRAFAKEELRKNAAAAAIPVYERLLLPASETHALATTAALAELNEVEATDALVRTALLSGWDSVRADAVNGLADRPLHDFVPSLLELLESPQEFAYRVRQDVFGNTTSVHMLATAGQQDNYVWMDASRRSPEQGTAYNEYRVNRAHTKVFYGPRRETGSLISALANFSSEQTDENWEELGKRYQEHRMRQFVTQVIAYQELVKKQRIQRAVNQRNQVVQWRNQRVHDILSRVANANVVDPDPVAWWSWWKDHNELSTKPRQTYVYRHLRSDPIVTNVVTICSCFPAGTPVVTERGIREIQSVLPGDRVLSQNLKTGELEFDVVTETTLREPAPTRRIQFEQGELTATMGHPLWVNNVGWRMVKQLEPGQRLHALGGVATIKELSLGRTAVTYNLVVDKNANFFVGGSSKVLAHDNSLRDSTDALTPGLAP